MNEELINKVAEVLAGAYEPNGRGPVTDDYHAARALAAAGLLKETP
ncbi:hypothetical protein [Jiangella anatolica]|nr:hypothetical protein [Jiangella anatolica]